MGETINVIAIDMGAESGRAIVGQYSQGKLSIEEVHRYPNISVRLPDGLHWDLPYLFNQLKIGIRNAVAKLDQLPVSVGLDTWGVDHGLLDQNGSLTFLPFHYRDNRTDGIMEEVFDLVPRSRIYQNTGLQFLPFNTLYQLMALKKCNSPALQSAVHFLTIPDLLNYWLTGKKVCEFSIATTTQCYDPIKNDWARELLLELGIPVHIFPEIVPACSLLGDLLPYIAEETGAFGLKVIAPACHDTGSAVLSVPAEESGVAFLSSGTWSLIGMEVDKPIITDQSLAMNFTNEGCVGGHFRFLKNITGLWIVQECRRYWATHGEEINYTDLTRMAEEAAPSIAFIDTDYQEFLKPGDMPIKVQKFCRETGQKVPETKGEIVRIILESLALKYKEEFTNIEQMAGNRIETMHIVGGGTQNLLLNQFSANALNRKVITGPVEATAIGNILGQLMALGVLSSTDEAREVVRNSFDTQVYTPSNISGWEASYERYLSIRKLE